MALDFPNTPVDGQVYDNYYYDASMQSWRAYGTVNLQVPAGIINQYGGSVAPDGYLLCSGQSVSTEEYPALFQAIGYAYGGSGLNFNVPNLQNRVPVGLGTETEFDALGETGGSKTHTLTVDQMPSHTHIQDAHNHTQNSHNHTQNSHNHTQNSHNHTQNAHTHSAAYANNVGGNLNAFALGSVTAQGAQVNSTTATNIATTATNIATTATNIATTATNIASTATNQNTGGGLAHNNLQPYIVLNYIIKT
jgi:microcystin-dependent protein